MKIAILSLIAAFAAVLFTGCEHEHWEHHHRDDGYRGYPGPGYEQGTGPHDHYDRDPRWDRDGR